jgi:hypothetical protein
VILAGDGAREARLITDAISERLLEGEKLLWCGRPQQGLLFTSRDALLIPFSLLWGGFALFWETMVLSLGAPMLFRFWGVPFVLIGLYIIAGRFILDAWVRSRTAYAVTNRRILIVRSGVFGNVTSLSLDRLPNIQLKERGDRRGTIRFGGLGMGYAGWGWGIWTPTLDPTPQFLAIEEAQRVYEEIEHASRNAA